LIQLFQPNSVADAVQPTVLVLAPVPVIEAVAVANVEALLAAIPPNGELYEPGKYLREGAVELPSIDPLGDQANDVGATARPVTIQAVRMGGFEPVQDTGSVQKVVYQGVNGDHARADFEPFGANVSSADQNTGQRHSEHLVGNPVDIAHWFNQSIACLRQGVWRGLVVCLFQSVVDPADQVAVGDIPNE
jgi:hypothetical protein